MPQFTSRTLMILCAIGFGSNARSTSAQSPPKPTLDQPAETAPLADVDSAIIPAAAPILGGTACLPDYWIVSSRHCPQRPDRECIACRLEFARRTSDCCLNRSTETGFRTWLKPGVPVCIVVHGSFVSSRAAIIDSHNTYRWLRSAAPNRSLQVVFFTWPSNELAIGVLPSVEVSILGKRSALNGLHLTNLLAMIPPSCPVSMIGHSHGARLVLSSLHLLGGGSVQGFKLNCDLACGRRFRAILAAAAVDHHWLNPGERYDRALCVTECLVNLRNSLDLPLMLYPLRKPFGREALARRGFTRGDAARLGASLQKVHEFDVTRQVRTGHMWPHYYRRAEIAWLLIPYIHFD
ncbi:MAG: alpha/beta hydrolase [Planctomycetota bacterium]|nr:alpha/beta hydrolase [Planctomycetota bacterium]